MNFNDLPTMIAPVPGCYTGTVDNNNAVIAVEDSLVAAMWYVFSSRLGQWVWHTETWDIEDGKYAPFYDRHPVTVIINAKSRKTSE